MQLVRADPDLATEAELRAIGEAAGGVPVDSGAIDILQELLCRRRIGCDYHITVMGAVRFDVGYCFIHGADNLHR